MAGLCFLYYGLITSTLLQVFVSFFLLLLLAEAARSVGKTDRETWEEGVESDIFRRNWVSDLPGFVRMDLIIGLVG
jgi:hypothetical protein